MSDDAEQQAEEIEVLESIYDGDKNFKQIDSTTYQYKYNEEGKSFILEIKWGTTYPTEKPTINLDLLYNQHLLPHVKEKILAILDAEAEKWVGIATTYTLFECLKDRLTEVLAEQTEDTVASRLEKLSIDDQSASAVKPDEKEPLEQAEVQKPRSLDRAENG